MYSTVLVTAPDLDTSRRISKHVIEEGLAACANIYPINSIYRWEGELIEEGEYAMLLKTRTEDFESLRTAVKELHPYEIPCIVRYEISEGHQPYLDWVGKSTRR
jgi:periplasmic divalent cation tolerance protein